MTERWEEIANELFIKHANADLRIEDACKRIAELEAERVALLKAAKEVADRITDGHEDFLHNKVLLAAIARAEGRNQKDDI